MTAKVKEKSTVFVGMSGGVDSSVSAALLKEQGYNVVGVFIKAWEPLGFDCGWREDRRDAMRAAAVLGVPFLTLDLSKEYKEEVVDYMIREYRNGRTPNPDVMCNKAIKFGAFYKRARAAGADFVATGHYARVREIKNEKLKIKNGNSSIRYQLLAGVDKNKDQSYFLWTLTQEQLAHTLFPIGHLEKPEVRKLAAKFKLPNFDKKDSQGLCFIGKLDVKDFLADFIKSEEGNVLDKDGRIIGKHRGAGFYTLGERRGFAVTENKLKTEPLYVTAKDMKQNTITVASESEMKKTGESLITLDSFSWTVEEPKPEKKYGGRIRYRQSLVSCRLSAKDGLYEVELSEPQTAASGQSFVLYDKEVCLGGGIIA